MPQMPEETISEKKPEGAGIRALVMTKPLRYEDRRFPIAIADADLGEKCLVIGKIITAHGNGKFLKVTAHDTNPRASGRELFTITFFHYRRWHTDLLKNGNTFAFLGKVTEFNGRRDLTQPTILDVADTGSIVPIYKRRGNTAGTAIGEEIATALDAASDDDINGITTQWVRRAAHKLGVMPIAQAAHEIHKPTSLDSLDAATEAMAHMELLERIEKTQKLKREREKSTGVMVHVSADEIQTFAADLPYTLSPGQKSALEQVRQSLASPWPSKILLIGGVASGKTAICHISARAVVYGAREGRNKVLIVAPTQPLCAQLHKTFTEYFPSIKTHSLVGSKLKEKIPDADVYFGTHGAFNRGLDWSRVGLVVFDEEHRFGTGVKFDTVPDTANRIFMSATPIPRSMSLFMFGDMEMVRIKGRPTDRRVETRVLTREQGREAVAQVRDTIASGRKAIVVYGTIRREDEEEIQWKDARYLSPRFPGDRVMPIRAAHDVRAARDESLDIHPDTLERFYRINKSFETRRLFMRYPGSESLAFPVLAYDSDAPNSLFILEKHAFIEIRDGKRKFKKWDALLKEIRAGFYPKVAMVRESLFRAGMDMDDATGYWERTFPDQVTVIHGRLKEKDKQAALDAFTAGDKPLIVATSIVEVGIDVKGVDCLVLANADRFGTASLVQLRGRVGRSGDYGICLLISPSDDGSDFARLQAFAEETDDMRLAEMDFKERGWGQINGTLQTGVPSTFFNLKKHAAIIEKISEKINR